VDLHFERVYNTSPAKIWWALTDPDALGRWYMKAEGLTTEVGSTFTLHDADAKGWSGWLDCELLVCDEPHVLKYRSTERKDQLVTDVTWTLKPEGTSTRVTLDHTGFTGVNGFVAGTMLRFGWRSLLKTEFAALIESSVSPGAV
jgi:uncharacterized protein YndB with AHSA1/START domain